MKKRILYLLAISVLIIGISGSAWAFLPLQEGLVIIQETLQGICNIEIFGNGTFNCLNMLDTITFRAGDGVIIYQSSTDNSTFFFNATSSGGEANTASNIGTGVGLFNSKVGVDLRFHSLVAGDNISITDIGNEIRINATEQSITARETLVNQIDDEKLLTDIGTSFVDPYSTANATGHATLIDTNGMNTVRLQILWQKIGLGTQTCQIVDIDNASNVLITSGSLTTGLNDGGDISIPAGLASTIKNYKIQCKSTVGTDSPSLFGFRVFLR